MNDSNEHNSTYPPYRAYTEDRKEASNTSIEDIVKKREELQKSHKMAIWSGEFKL